MPAEGTRDLLEGLFVVLFVAGFLYWFWCPADNRLS